jgi:hypothetical protein
MGTLENHIAGTKAGLNAGATNYKIKEPALANGNNFKKHYPEFRWR